MLNHTRSGGGLGTLCKTKEGKHSSRASVCDMCQVLELPASERTSQVALSKCLSAMNADGNQS